MKVISYFTLMFMAIFFVACNGGGGANNTNNSQNSGINTNQSSEQYLNSIANIEVKKFATKTHESLRMALNADLNDDQKLRDIVYKNAHAIKCLYGVSQDKNQAKEMVKTIERLALKNEQELNRYLQFNKALSGKSWAWPKEGDCNE